MCPTWGSNRGVWGQCSHQLYPARAENRFALSVHFLWAQMLSLLLSLTWFQGHLSLYLKLQSLLYSGAIKSKILKVWQYAFILWSQSGVTERGDEKGEPAQCDALAAGTSHTDQFLDRDIQKARMWTSLQGFEMAASMPSVKPWFLVWKEQSKPYWKRIKLVCWNLSGVYLKAWLSMLFSVLPNLELSKEKQPECLKNTVQRMNNLQLPGEKITVETQLKGWKGSWKGVSFHPKAPM